MTGMCVCVCVCVCVCAYVCVCVCVCVDVGRRVVAKEKKSNVRRAVKKSEVRRKGERRERGAVCQLHYITRERDRGGGTGGWKVIDYKIVN